MVLKNKLRGDLAGCIMDTYDSDSLGEHFLRSIFLDYKLKGDLTYDFKQWKEKIIYN